MFRYNLHKAGGIRVKNMDKIYCYHCFGEGKLKKNAKKNLKDHTSKKHKNCAPCWSISPVKFLEDDVELNEPGNVLVKMALHCIDLRNIVMPKLWVHGRKITIALRKKLKI